MLQDFWGFSENKVRNITAKLKSLEESDDSLISSHRFDISSKQRTGEEE